MKRGTSAITKLMRGTTVINKIMRGTTLLWQYSQLIVGTVHPVVVAQGIYFSIDAYSGTTPIVKNPSIYIDMWGRCGYGEVSDYRDYWVYAKRVSDGGWDNVFYQRNNHDVENSSDGVNTTITLSNGVQYNQFRYVMTGFGHNTYGCNNRVTQYWT